MPLLSIVFERKIIYNEPYKPKKFGRVIEIMRYFFIMKCPFCGGEYRPIKPPVNRKVAFYVPNCAPSEDGGIIPDGGIICDAFVCTGCGNIQMIAKRRPDAPVVEPKKEEEKVIDLKKKPEKKTAGKKSTQKQ